MLINYTFLKINLKIIQRGVIKQCVRINIIGNVTAIIFRI